ncbi:hypothetical protein N7513_007727 [Penicillium frequentans]|nr:hypothetical protein N7513_007727 [Penicillium glabrum]
MPSAKKRKSNYSTVSSLELLNKPQSRRHTIHNERNRYGLRSRQDDSSIPQSSEPAQEQHDLSPELEQEQPERSPEPSREQSEPSPELNPEQSEVSSEEEQIRNVPESSDDEGHVDPTNIYVQEHKVEDQGEPHHELDVIPYGGVQDEEIRIQDFQSEEDQDEISQHEYQDEREEERDLSNPQPNHLEALQVVVYHSVENDSRHNRGVTSPASSDSVPETPLATTLSRKSRMVRREDSNNVVLDAEISDHNEDEHVYEGIATLDLDLKDWLVTKVQNTRWSEEWMLFHERTLELPKFVYGPMPTSFIDAFQLIECLIDLFNDLENLPVDLETKVKNLRAATFTEVKGILNFNEVPTEDLDPKIAGDLVVYLEGYLLPHIAILVMRSFRAYTLYGVPASTAFDDSLGLLVDCCERIEALRGYFQSELKRQRSWRLGIRAKHFKQALKKNQLGVFLTAEAQAPPVPRTPPTLHGWTRSEEMWLRDAWEQYDSSEPTERFILIKTHLANQFSRHTMSSLRLKARELGLDY